MSIQEITTIEDQNTGEIHLHKEGMFWKAYQQSAYLFTREVKAFKVSKKWVKAVGREVAGFGEFQPWSFKAFPNVSFERCA
jgi:hypothetical protein